jgi:hypothetical protein
MPANCTDSLNQHMSLELLIRRLYDVVTELERLHPERRFTPDGHLVGSIGEVVAAKRYGLMLLPASEKTHDAVTDGGVRVQIKITQRTTVALRSEPQHLLVLKLTPAGDVLEVFNGPGDIAWEASGNMQANGQRSISFRRLRELRLIVDSADQLPVI